MLRDIKGRVPKSWLLILGLALTGCASSGTSITPQAHQPQTIDQIIAAADFKQVFPTVPAQKAILTDMPQKRMFLISKDTKVYYVYADVNGCGCLYAGNQQDYDKYKRLAADAQLIAEQYEATRMNDWDWNNWGPAWWGVGTGEPE